MATHTERFPDPTNRDWGHRPRDRSHHNLHRPTTNRDRSHHNLHRSHHKPRPEPPQPPPKHPNTRSGAGATSGGTLDLATLIKPVLSNGQLRVVGSTTFDEFKQIEKGRSLAPRLQKIDVEEPSA